MPYTIDDYLQTPAPYEEAYAYHGNPFEYSQKVEQMARDARQAGFNGFKKMLAKYTEGLKAAAFGIYLNNATEFTGQPLEIDAGDWTADDFGVRRGHGVEEEACCHPIMPVERLINIDSGAEKLRLWYARSRRPREVIVEKSLLASPQKIIALADLGIAVNSENAKTLIQWLHDAENKNYELIPERKSVSRLGYIPEEGFSPYVDGLIFDGDANYRPIFEAVSVKGSLGGWLKSIQAIRESSVMARIVLAASFASPLVSVVGALPFFVHLWGGESGTGKTVALMIAASVWGNPEPGRYIQTFNSTRVGQEKLAAFLNHLPVLIDELQLTRNARGKPEFDVYSLAEGVGRTRGTRTGGIERTPTWRNCIITTGETPITGAGAAAGAVNRVIEIECTSSAKVVENGHETAAAVKKDYGYAGREFVERLYEDASAQEFARTLYKEAFRSLSDSDTTEKQAMAAAVIYAADRLATEWIFRDGRALELDEISGFLASKAAVSTGDRGYRYMCDWAAQNANRLQGTAEQGDVYGMICGDWVWIIGSVFRRAAEDAGYSSSALLSYLRERGLIETRGRAMTRCKRINGVKVECVCMKLIGENDEEICSEVGEYEQDFL